MAIGSIGTGATSTGPAGTRLAGQQAQRAQDRSEPTIADHVAAADDQEPIRALSTSRGTLVDTYL